MKTAETVLYKLPDGRSAELARLKARDFVQLSSDCFIGVVGDQSPASGASQCVSQALTVLVKSELVCVFGA